MAAAVENSKAVCFFLSKDYQDSRACKKELQYADELEKPLIPCRLLRDWKPSGWLGLINTGLKWYDFRDFDDNTKKQKIQSSTEELIRFIQVAFFSSKDEIDSINSHRLVKDDRTTSASLRNSLHERLHDQSSGRNERQRSSTVIRNPVSHLEWYDGPSRDVLDALPFAKYAQFPLLSLEEAIKSLDPFIPDIQNRALIAKQHANLYLNKRVLTKDEAAAIILYTMGEGEENLCRYLNRVVRSQNRKAVKPWFPFFKLFLTALFKLSKDRTLTPVYRAVQTDLSCNYEVGERITWWGVIPCTRSLAVLHKCLGDDGTRTVFQIQTENSKSVSAYSIYRSADQEQVFLPPGCYLQVVNKSKAPSGLIIIDLKETEPPFPFIDSPLELFCSYGCPPVMYHNHSCAAWIPLSMRRAKTIRERKKHKKK